MGFRFGLRLNGDGSCQNTPPLPPPPPPDHGRSGVGQTGGRGGRLQDRDRNERRREITHHGVRDENLALVAVVLLLHFLSRDGLKSNLHHGDPSV